VDKNIAATKQDDPAEGPRDDQNDSGTTGQPARRPGSGLAPDPQANRPEDRDKAGTDAEVHELTPKDGR
jgi:hypothetical protein